MSCNESNISDFIIYHYDDLQEFFDFLAVKCNLTIEELIDAFEELILSKRKSFESE
jgi:hypothetical protein